MGAYGYERDTTPFLNDMAEKGFYHPAYYANAPWTAPAHATIFTGDLPSAHGVTAYSPEFEAENVLVQGLKDRGFSTHGVSENPLVSSQTGFASEFDQFFDFSAAKAGEVWEDVWENEDRYISRSDKWVSLVLRSVWERDVQSLQSVLRHIRDKIALRFTEETYNPIDAGRTISTVGSLLESEEDSFVFVNLMATHAKYTFTDLEKDQFLEDTDPDKVGEMTDPVTLEDALASDTQINEEFLSIREAAYDASIRYVDRLIRRLWENAPDNTVFVVVGDHGELFGEYKIAGHQIIGHHGGTFKELVEVPLIVFPGQWTADTDNPLSHQSLKEILFALVDGEESFPVEDQVIVEYQGIKALNGRFDEAYDTRLEQLASRKSLSLITRDWKYDYTTEGEHLWERAGFTEDMDLWDSVEPSLKKELFEILTSSLNAEPNTVFNSEKTEQRQSDTAVKNRLNQLGYI